MTALSVVIPSWNTKGLLRACLGALESAQKPATEVIVVDNGSVDGSPDMVAEEFPRARLVRNEQNEGFARGCNQGMELAQGRWVLLLNSDTEVAPDALVRMIAFLEENPQHGAVAPRLVHPDGRTQNSCARFPSFWTPLFFATPFERWWPRSRELRRYHMQDFDHESSRDVDQPPAACLLLRAEALRQVGHFDERLWLFFNDVDLSRRLHGAGWKTHYLAEAEVLHHEGASTGQFGEFVAEWQRNRLIYYRKHYPPGIGLWVKACVGFAWADFCLSQLLARVRGEDSEPLGPTTGKFVRFLGS